MKLSYFDEVPNFGDALNPLLAPKLFGDVFSQSCSDRLLFIGTTIGRKAPAGCREIIVGAGAGYQKGSYSLDRRKVFCVRGPATCDILGIDRDHAAIDPAILVNRFFPAERSPAIFMPHHQSHAMAERVLRDACAGAGLQYVSPLDPAEKIVKKIGGADRVVTEALHGAVVAESFGVPWIPVVFGSKILIGKWDDFCASIGVEYQPAEINTNIAFDGSPRISDRIKYAAYRVGLGKPKYKYLPIRRVSKSALSALEDDLRRLATRDSSIAHSNKQVKSVSLDRLDRAVESFKNWRVSRHS